MFDNMVFTPDDLDDFTTHTIELSYSDKQDIIEALNYLSWQFNFEEEYYLSDRVKYLQKRLEKEFGDEFTLSR